MEDSAQMCAQEVLEVIPLVMRTIRTQMRQSTMKNLSVPQFRTLSYIHRHPDTSLTEVAEYLGSTAPSASALVEGVVARNLVTRQDSQLDRRRITLNLTDEGRLILDAAHEETQAFLAEILAKLSAQERERVIQAMNALRQIFMWVELQR
jgi:DNA-binding MarR family transcriptional regulator